MKIALVDDNSKEMNLTKTHLDNYLQTNEINDISIVTFSNAFNLLDYLDHNPSFDIYILDIYMPGIDGIDLAKIIKEHDSHCEVIFVTTSKDFALASYEIGAIQYLVKPYSKERLYNALDKALEMIGKNEEKCILIKADKGYHKIKVDDILFIESNNHQQNFYLKNEVITSRLTSLELMELLKGYDNFVKCHQSYVVNLDKITGINKNKVLIGTDEIDISKRMSAKFKNNYLLYMNKKRED